jgi:hypothetical protein
MSAMRSLLVVAALCFPFCAGCASEREAFFNHNPFTDATITIGEMIGGYFQAPNCDLTDVRHSPNKSAEIRPL